LTVLEYDIESEGFTESSTVNSRNPLYSLSYGEQSPKRKQGEKVMKSKHWLVLPALGLTVTLTLALLLVLGMQTKSVAAAPAAELHVCPAGPPTCDYATVQEAVDAANDGDVIKAATGDYTDVNNHGGLAQVVYINKTVTIQGGYTVGDWDTPDPVANPTTLDAQGQGRVVYITGDISPTLEGLRITGGDSTGLLGYCGWWDCYDTGGGIHVITATATISGCHVYSNRSPNYGGGLYLHQSPSTLTGNTISDNATDDFGGGLYLDHSIATLTSNTISDNTAGDWGGGAQLNNSDATLIGNTVVNNTSGGHGGGLFVYVSQHPKLIGNTISGNASSRWGGGLYLNNAHAEVRENTIANNTSSWEGGGVLMMFSRAILSDNVITNNSADDKGGGIYIRECEDATLARNTIQNNTAQAHGGGLHVFMSTVTLDNNVVTDNRTYQNGAGVYIEGATVHARHTTLARNYGGDGSGVHVTEHNDWIHQTHYYSNVDLIDTILVAHNRGIVVTVDNTATLEGTLWGSGAWANTTDWSGAGTINTGTINLWDDPDFVDPDNGDYHIGPASAAVDTGVNSGLLDDIDGDPRPANIGYDLGADERPGAVLRVEKRAWQPVVNLGQVLTYTIRIVNITAEAATSVILTDTLPLQQRPLAATPTQGNCNLGNGWGALTTCNLGDIGAGGSAEITLTAEVTSTQPGPFPFTMRNIVQVRGDNAVAEAFEDVRLHNCYVRINGTPPDYSHPQTAIDAAGDGDRLWIAGLCLGTQEKDGFRQVAYLDKNLTLRGGYSTDFSTWDPATQPTILDATGEGRVAFITGTTSSSLEWLVITGGDSTPGGSYEENAGGGVAIISATATISSCQVYSNTAENGGGLYLEDGSTATMTGNTIFTNTAAFEGGGLYLDDGSTVTLVGNSVSNNIAWSGGGAVR
jgi:uncharacterized repeat protein (TIGR01451 family)